MTEKIKLGDLVWAKMKGFSPWPGRVALPTLELKPPKKAIKNMRCIYFFGTNNYAWIEDIYIKPYQEHKEQLIKSCKTVAFKDAVAEIEEFILHPEKFPDIDSHVKDPEVEFDKLKQMDGEHFIKEEQEDSTTAEGYEEHRKKPTSTPKIRLGKAKNAKRASTGSTKTSVPRKRNKSNRSITIDLDTNEKSMLNHSFSKKSSLLHRPSNIHRPDTPPLDLESISNTLLEKNIQASQMTFGFLGLGIMGGGIVKNLLNSGHKVVVWNRTDAKAGIATAAGDIVLITRCYLQSALMDFPLLSIRQVECKEFEKVGAAIGETPCDVIEEADITFSCVSDPQAAKEMVFGNCGVLHCLSLEQKGYVEMTSIDADTSHDIVEAISGKGGRYLEAQIQGSRSQAEEGTLILLAAGDRSLFDDCQSCFKAMSKNSFYLGDVGNASKMNSVLQVVGGVSLAALAEGLALADRAGLNQADLLDVLALTPMASPHLILKGRAMIDSTYSTHQPLAHMQKDLKLALGLGDTLEQSLPLTATTNEIFKHAKRLGYANHDVSAVYIRARF